MKQIYRKLKQSIDKLFDKTPESLWSGYLMNSDKGYSDEDYRVESLLFYKTDTAGVYKGYLEAKFGVVAAPESFWDIDIIISEEELDVGDVSYEEAKHMMAQWEKDRKSEGWRTYKHCI